VPLVVPAAIRRGASPCSHCMQVTVSPSAATSRGATSACVRSCVCGVRLAGRQDMHALARARKAATPSSLYAIQHDQRVFKTLATTHQSQRPAQAVGHSAYAK
jgi:hypothetical protein